MECLGRSVSSLLAQQAHRYGGRVSTPGHQQSVKDGTFSVRARATTWPERSPTQDHNPLWHRLATRSDPARLSRARDESTEPGVDRPGGLSLQRKPTIGAADDPYEREADRVAQRVMSMPRPEVIPGNSESMPTTREARGAAEPPAATISRLPARVPADRQASFEPGAEFEARLSASEGSPLPASAREFMEPRFEADFSAVRLHTGREAAQLNRAVRARAFTHGHDIYLGEGRDNVESSAGRQLLAHELTHTIQQRAVGSLGAPGPRQHSPTVDGGLVQRDGDDEPAAGAFDVPTLDQMPPDYFKQGYETGLRGDDPNPGPLSEENLDNYNEGYAKGHHESGRRLSSSKPPAQARQSVDPAAAKVPAPEPSPLDPDALRVAALDEAYRSALAKRDWRTAAEHLNAFNADDILARLTPLTEQDLLNLEDGAWQNPRVGGKAQVAVIIHGVVSAIDPTAYSPTAVFPNNFGDNLGPVGGAVIMAAGGLLALRLAMPLLAGYWRQIQISAGMAKIASEVDKEDAALAEQEIGTVIEKLMNSGGSQRVLVTYQSMSPVLDKELYLTTEKGAQYAEAVAQGRNLYMLRIPERLYQLLIERQLLEVPAGSDGRPSRR